LLATSAERSALAYAARLDALRTRIRAAYGISAQTDIVFAPSGTDLEYVALALALGRSEQGIHNVLLGADETGSGCIHSAHGRFFANETALTDGVAPGEEIAGMGEITLVDVPVRCPDGEARSSAEIAAGMAQEIAAARAAGRHSVVHCVHGSKTGLVLPALADLDALMAEFGEDATFVVDACQARITSAAIADYLARGVIVLMTGSKFVGAPPFNGWALVPRALSAGAAPLPEGFALVFRRAEWPAGWPGADRLEDSANAALALRLEAALFEIERFQAIPMTRVETMIAAFEAALRDHLMAPLGLARVTPGSGDDGESPIEMRTLATLDLSGLAGLETFDAAQAAHKALALDGIRLGQPVKCVRVEAGWGGTMRVGLSMPQLIAWDALEADERNAGLARDMARIAAGLQAVAADRAG
jgi:selenocysteine lyase/cysteine desulfurase